ncbi:MAG: hypothetical protein SGJ02_11130 [bacterium]|nr:hypothetical protein [bacterium]
MKISVLRYLALLRAYCETTSVTRKERFEPIRGNRERKPQAYPLGYVEDFLSKTDEVPGQRSLFAVGESFATGPLWEEAFLKQQIPGIAYFNLL